MAQSRRKRKTARQGSGHGAMGLDELLKNAQEARQAGRRQEAARLCGLLVTVLGEDADGRPALALRLRRDGRVEDALLILDAWVTRYPQDAGVVQLLRANFLFESARAAEALQIVLTLIADDESNVSARTIAAACYEQLDQAAEALEQVERGLAIDPANRQLRIMRAHWERRNGNCDAAILVLEEILGGDQLELTLQRKAFHELGMALNQGGRYDEAFAAFSKCGEATAQTVEGQGMNPRRAVRRMLAYRKATNMAYFREARAVVESFGEEREPPIFLVGFPRSGTTMTEQVLQAHPAIETADERPCLHETRREAFNLTGSHGDEVRMLGGLTPAMVRQLRGHYRRLLRESFPDYGARASAVDCLMIDKLPLNIIDLPFVNAIFPDAKVIVALRDPRAVCLSCLMQDFRLNAEMANFLTLESTVQFYARVMGNYLDWRTDFTMRMLEIRYEDTVADLEGQARKLLGFLGLAWDPAVLRFHEQARARVISTPSFAAVREPIHGRAMQRWHHYAGHLKTAEASLQRFVDAFNYADGS